MDTQTKDIAPGDRTTFGVVRWKYCQKCGQWYQGKRCPICGRTQESIGEARLSGRVRIYHDLPYKDAIFIYPLSGVSIEQLHEILWGSGVKLKGLFPMEELGVLQVAIRGRQDLSDFTEDVKAVLEAVGIKVVPKIGRLGDLEPKFLGQESFGKFADTILEDTARDMKRMTDPSFLDQGRRKKKVGEPELVEMEPDDTMVFRVESGTEPGKFYTLNIQLLGWEEAKADKRASLSRRAKKALGSNLRLRCSCPSFLFHGFQYIETIRDSQFGPAEHRYPEVRNPELKGIVCKHLARLLDELPRFEYDLYKYLKRD